MWDMICQTRSVGHFMWYRICRTRSVGHVMWDCGTRSRDCMTAFDADVYGRESCVNDNVFRC